MSKGLRRPEAIRSIPLSMAVLAGCSGLLLPQAARAMVTRSESSIVLPADQTIRDDAAMTGDLIQVSAKIDGDFAAAGRSVATSGPVSGDVLATGSDIAVQGPVGGSLRALGGTVIVSGKVDRSVTAFGGNVLLQESARIGRNAVLAGGQVTVFGPVARDLDICAGQATVASAIDGALVAHVGQLTLGPGAAIRGDVDVYASRPPEIEPGAHVFGQVRYHPATGTGASQERPQSPLRGFGRWIGEWLFRFAALFLLGAALMASFPHVFAEVAGTLRHHLVPSAVYGLLEMVALPMATLALAAGIVGIPLALTLLALYGATLIMAQTFVAYRAGVLLMDRMRSNTSSAYLHLFVGSLLISLLAVLPYVGGLFQLLFLVTGSGALISRIWASTRQAGNRQAGKMSAISPRS